MDTRKLILHIDGDSGVQSRIELEDFGTTHYIDGDTDMVAELVKRHNAYPDLVAALEAIRNWSNSRDGSAETDEAALTEINGIAARTLLATLNSPA